MFEALLSWFGTTASAALLLSVMVFVAHRWSLGSYDFEIKHLRRVGKEYGIVTLFFVALWWIVIPTATPDDVIFVWLIATLGLVPYLVLLGLVTAYVVWRLKVSIVIYKGNKK